MSGKEFGWILFAILIAILDLAVPYTVLKNVAKFTGPYLYWTVLVLVVIIAGWIYVAKWRTDVTLEEV